MFPNYKPYLLFFKKPDGWEDLGKRPKTFEANPDFDPSDYELINYHGVILRDYYSDEYIVSNWVCNFCGTETHLGKENNTFFHFCPKCKVKTHE
jgi:ABC-type ATPase with predicted acetyltransferase domain